MHNFFGDINYHYYIIYPPVFLQDYHSWWEKRRKKRPLSLQYTCLLAIICACALQHVEPASEQVFTRELGDNLDVVSDQLHAAMRELASVIPVGHYHILNVQRLLHSCYWYKAEAKFLEAWHVLSAAILEARELGFHKAPPPDTVSDFDLEMRRRLWCISDTWDWYEASSVFPLRQSTKLIPASSCQANLVRSFQTEDYRSCGLRCRAASADSRRSRSFSVASHEDAIPINSATGVKIQRPQEHYCSCRGPRIQSHH